MKKERTSRTKTIRERYGLTQRELANLLGISRAHLGMYEQRRRALPTDASTKLAEMIVVYYSLPADAGKGAGSNARKNLE